MTLRRAPASAWGGAGSPCHGWRASTAGPLGTVFFRLLRSWQSRAKATRTTLPFQQVNSRPSEHQRTFGADRRHLAVMLAGSSPTGMALEQEAVLLHQPVDALVLIGARPSDRRSRLRSGWILRQP